LSISPRVISRVINLSFKVSGLKEGSDQVAEFAASLNTLLRGIIAITMAYRAYKILTSADPTFTGLVMLGIGVASMFSVGESWSKSMTKQSKLGGGG